MKQEHKDLAKKYLWGNIPSPSDPSIFAWQAISNDVEILFDYILDNLTQISSEETLEDHFTTKETEERQAKIAELESLLADLPIQQAKLRAEINELKESI